MGQRPRREPHAAPRDARRRGDGPVGIRGHARAHHLYWTKSPIAKTRRHGARPPAAGPGGDQGAPRVTNTYHWGMIIDLDRCTGCQACVVACQAENNIPINEEQPFVEHRAKEWIRIERYWDGEFSDVKA